MKKLQRNFTNPEQSNRLLELGVPADSADMYYHKDIGLTDFFFEPEVIPEDELFSTFTPIFVFDLPCWSVGRLIEIYEICFGGYFGYRYFGHTLMEDVLLKIEEQIDSINFSKLME